MATKSTTADLKPGVSFVQDLLVGKVSENAAKAPAAQTPGEKKPSCLSKIFKSSVSAPAQEQPKMEGAPERQVMEDKEIVKLPTTQTKEATGKQKVSTLSKEYPLTLGDACKTSLEQVINSQGITNRFRKGCNQLPAGYEKDFAIISKVVENSRKSFPGKIFWPLGYIFLGLLEIVVRSLIILLASPFYLVALACNVSSIKAERAAAKALSLELAPYKGIAKLMNNPAANPADIQKHLEHVAEAQMDLMKEEEDVTQAADRFRNNAEKVGISSENVEKLVEQFQDACALVIAKDFLKDPSDRSFFSSKRPAFQSKVNDKLHQIYQGEELRVKNDYIQAKEHFAKVSNPNYLPDLRKQMKALPSPVFSMKKLNALHNTMKSVPKDIEDAKKECVKKLDHWEKVIVIGEIIVKHYGKFPAAKASS